MNWLIHVFASGDAFFVGIAFVLATVIVFTFVQRSWVKIVGTLAVIVGLLLIVFSATPLPYSVYAVAGGATLLWLVEERSHRPVNVSRRKWIRGVVFVCWAITAGLEIPYHVVPRVESPRAAKICIVGDSLSAGLGQRGEYTWPRIIASETAIEVVDCSGVGATAASALRQVQRFPQGPLLVLLEIGGNDLLGTTSAWAFERDLDRLLAAVCSPERVVVMFELPLPPFHNEFGRAQRTLAANNGVTLIPKRVLASVLTDSGGTVDSLHLSAEGHRKLAAAVLQMIRTEK
jgi:acyl-CoA thioesterase-1